MLTQNALQILLAEAEAAKNSSRVLELQGLLAARRRFDEKFATAKLRLAQLRTENSEQDAADQSLLTAARRLDEQCDGRG